MFCTKCGAPLEDGSSFCTMCGTPVEGSSEADSHAESVAASSQAPGSAPSSVAASAPVSASPSIPAPAPVPAPAPAPVPASKRAPIIIAVVAVIVVAAIGCAWFAISSNAANEEGAQGRVQSQPADVPGKGASSDEGSEASPSEGSASIVDSQKKGFEGVTSATASSYLPVDAINNRGYTAANAIDGSAQRAWVEGASGSGIGEWIAFRGDGEQGFSGFDIWNGYQESDDIYSKNARPSSVSVYVDGEKIGWYQLQDSGLGSQRVDFGDTFVGTEIRLVIDSVYPGWKYEDCGISEISFY